MLELLQLFPTLPTPIEEALRLSIERFGVLVAVTKDQYGRILDGHHRVRLAEELRVPYRVDVLQVGSEEEAREIARTLNADRRQLTEEQRREVAVALRQAGHSERAIAGALGVSQPTVHRDLERATDSGVSVQPERVYSLDGKSRPATRVISTTPQAYAAPVPAMWQEPPAPEEAPPKPHVAQNSGNNEWYTPPEYLTAARLVLGGIDLDPASSPIANQAVQAARFFTAQDDGLTRPWHGRVWLNPPYASDLIGRFAAKLRDHVTARDVQAALVLVNNATETTWFHTIAQVAQAICFPLGRVRFLDPEGNPGAPLQGQAVLYIGADVRAFRAAFQPFGLVVTL